VYHSAREKIVEMDSYELPLAEVRPYLALFPSLFSDSTCGTTL
jgi:hypothetical protein